MENYSENPITIRDLYPHLSEEEAKLADEQLDEHLAWVLRIYERVAQDPEALARLRALTQTRSSSTLKIEKVEAIKSST